jgi:hypothetical protein
MIVSILYHLFETKHHLSGLPFLNQYSYQLLWIDRIGAMYASLYMMKKVYDFPSWFTKELLLIGVIGFISLAYSEKDTIWMNLFGETLKLSNVEFVLSHSLWHFCAMKCFSLLL